MTGKLSVWPVVRARLTRASAGSSICCLPGTSTAFPHFASRRGVPPLWAIATADARPCTWPRTLMLHLPLACAAYSIGAGRCFARGFDRDSRALPQLVAAACQVGGLGGVAGQLDGFAVRRTRLLTAAQPAQQVGAGRMVGVIAGQLVLKTVDGRQCHLRAVKLGHRDGPVEGDDRRGVDADELVVEGEDLRPVGVTYVAGGGVHGADRCKDLVATRGHPGG